MLLDPMPVAHLSNGITVYNFSSAHPFSFTDGTVLEGCSPERCRSLMLTAQERRMDNPNGWTDIELSFELSDAVRNEVERIIHDQTYKGRVIVLVPFPVMGVLENLYSLARLRQMPFRVIQKADRVTQAVCIDRFCIGS